MTARRLRIGLASATKLVLLAVSLGVTTALRFVRLFPNNDPIMAVMLSNAKRGRLSAVAFPVVAMVLFDVLSQRVGVWTVITAATYGLLGLGFSYAYSALTKRGRSIGAAMFLVSGVAGVLVFDFVTGPIMSSALFHMSFAEAFVGQIPFTLKHLASVAAYSLVVSPALDWVLRQIETGEKAIERRLAAVGHQA
jgi:biotin transporter BioY